MHQRSTRCIHLFPAFRPVSALAPKEQARARTPVCIGRPPRADRPFGSIGKQDTYGGSRLGAELARIVQKDRP